MSNNSGKREFDVVIYGATSFVGEITAQHFADNYPLKELKWAIAGRSRSKLEQVKQNLVKSNPSLKDLELLFADSQNKAELDKITSRTTALITTVGPYALYGEQVVASCVDNSTGYLDLTGEAFWAKQTIDRYHKKAEEKSALIVHFSGFDSIPSDMGALMMADHIKTKLGGETVSVKTFVTDAKGGVSGGTIASAINMFESGNASSGGGDTHLLCPSPKTCHARAPGPSDTILPRWDEDAQHWTAPFVMAEVNTRVVRRSAALLGEGSGYSPKFVYQERFQTANVLIASVVTFALFSFFLLASFPPTRFLLKKVLPAPGQGPSKEQREKGHWQYQYVATAKTKSGEVKKVRGRSGGKKDPGYGDTAVMLAEAAVYLVRNRDKCAKGGVLTPASAFGTGFLKSLNNFGMYFTVDSE
eukprot:TRINITY_DN715_c0_g1_i1.p1 TRINITY_DN715_c0_g1~~TRINITY_DN715_c0_g1_i1.p1  ORF type:complete len:416 (-),score=134.92 TRINITY_DN715_c0_g1_i1:82-1329(-)